MIETAKIAERGISLKIRNVYPEALKEGLVVVAGSGRQRFAADFLSHLMKGCVPWVTVINDWKDLKTRIPVDLCGKSLVVARFDSESDELKSNTFLAGMLTGSDSRSVGDGNFARCFFQVRTGDPVGNSFNRSEPTLENRDCLSVALQDGMILVCDKGMTHIAGLASRLNLPDPACVEEVTGVVAMALYLGASVEKICRGVESFCARPMFLDYVGSLYGLRYFDNSDVRDFVGCCRVISYFDERLAVILGGPGFRMNPLLEAELIRRDVDLVVLPHTPWSELEILHKLIRVRRARSVKDAVRTLGGALEAGASVLFFPGLHQPGREVGGASYEFFHEVLNH